jgi:hypothetical protein
MRSAGYPAHRGPWCGRQSADVALISSDGTADWWRSPARFDSASVFASLLDASRGGHFVLRPAGGALQSKQLYFADTNVLVSRQLG